MKLASYATCGCAEDQRFPKIFLHFPCLLLLQRHEGQTYSTLISLL